MLQLLVLALSALLDYVTGLQSEITNVSSCEFPLPATVDITFDQSRPQKLNITIHTPFDLDENLINIFELYTVFQNQRPILLGKLVDKDGPCESLKRYAGSGFSDFQRRIGAIPGKCPLRKGNHSVKNYVLDYSQMKIPNLPKTSLIIVWKWRQKLTNKLVQCTMVATNSY